MAPLNAPPPADPQALALAHVVVLFAGFSQEVSVEHGDSLATILVLTAAVVVVARLVGHRTEAGRLAAQTFLALGVVYAASTLAVGFAPGAGWNVTQPGAHRNPQRGCAGARGRDDAG